jgi:hypothetical protein
MRSLLLLVALLAASCSKQQRPANPPPATARDSARVRAPAPARDTALEQRAARLELRVLEQEAQVGDLQNRLDEARREVVRAMAKLQSQATRAEAASGMAEAEIALQALRSAGGNTAPAPEWTQGSRLLQLATAEFDQQNYAGALYLATEAKNATAAGQRRATNDDRGTPRRGEVPFALPLRLQTTGRANIREGPGSNFKVLFTLENGMPLVAFSYVDQWVRVTADDDRTGWIHQSLIGRRE